MARSALVILSLAICSALAAQTAAAWAQEDSATRAEDGGQSADTTTAESGWHVVADTVTAPALPVPLGLAVDANASILVSGIGSTLLRLSPTGNVTAEWRVDLATGVDRVGAVTVDRAGNVYIGAGSRVEKLSPSGELLVTWTRWVCPTCSIKDQIIDAGSLAVDDAGNIYIGGNLGSMLVLSPHGDHVADWNSGSDVFLANGASYVAVDSAGDVYVANPGAFNRDIQKFTPDGQVVARWADTLSGPLQLPTGVALDGDGNIYVADSGSNKISKLSPTGEPLAEWGGAGDGPGEFNAPTGIVVDAEGNLYVADTGNHRIQVLPAANQ